MVGPPLSAALPQTGAGLPGDGGVVVEVVVVVVVGGAVVVVVGAVVGAAVVVDGVGSPTGGSPAVQ